MLACLLRTSLPTAFRFVQLLAICAQLLSYDASLEHELVCGLPQRHTLVGYVSCCSVEKKETHSPLRRPFLL
jgi:hypothetical protein